MQDRYLKIMLTLVAVLLAANLAQSLFTNDDASTELFVGNANARSSSSTRYQENYKLTTLKGFTVNELTDVVALGDGKSFIVSNSTGFMVYQVLPTQ